MPQQMKTKNLKKKRLLKRFRKKRALPNFIGLKGKKLRFRPYFNKNKDAITGKKVE
jgi:hypothetical protein